MLFYSIKLNNYMYKVVEEKRSFLPVHQLGAPAGNLSACIGKYIPGKWKRHDFVLAYVFIMTCIHIDASA